MKDDKATYLVYFSPQKEEKDRYRLLIAGKETDVYLNKRDIMKILTTTQFKDFVKEIGIYEVSKRTLAPYLRHEPSIDPKTRWKAQ